MSIAIGIVVLVAAGLLLLAVAGKILTFAAGSMMQVVPSLIVIWFILMILRGMIKKLLG